MCCAFSRHFGTLLPHKMYLDVLPHAERLLLAMFSSTHCDRMLFCNEFLEVDHTVHHEELRVSVNREWVKGPLAV